MRISYLYTVVSNLLWGMLVGSSKFVGNCQEFIAYAVFGKRIFFFLRNFRNQFEGKRATIIDVKDGKLCTIEERISQP